MKNRTNLRTLREAQRRIRIDLGQPLLMAKDMQRSMVEKYKAEVRKEIDEGKFTLPTE